MNLPVKTGSLKLGNVKVLQVIPNRMPLFLMGSVALYSATVSIKKNKLLQIGCCSLLQIGCRCVVVIFEFQAHSFEISLPENGYGVATISRLLKIRGLVCKRALLKRRYSAKEIYNSSWSTNRSHPVI